MSPLFIGLALILVKALGYTSANDTLSTELAKQIVRSSKAAEIKSFMNTEVKPCNNFYDYATGNWEHVNPAKTSNPTTNVQQEISKGFNRRLLRFLQSKQPSSKLQEKLQSFYASCLQSYEINDQFQSALKKIYHKFGELPVVAGKDWDPREFSWWRSVALIQKTYGIEILLSVQIMRDIRNNTVNRVYVGPPAIGLYGDEFDPSGVSYYITRKLGVDWTTEMLASLRTKILEYTAGEFSSKGIKDQIKMYTLDELQAKYHRLNIREFLGIILGPSNVPKRVYVYDEYLSSLMTILKTEMLSTIGNYVLYKLLQEFLLSRLSTQLPLLCVEQTKRRFGKLTNHLLYAQYSSAAAEAELRSIWDNLHAAFRQELEGTRLDWMSKRTRQRAIKKLKHMQLNIDSYDNENFEAMYSKLPMDKENYLSNVQSLMKAQAQRFRSTINQTTSAPSTKLENYLVSYNKIDNEVRVNVMVLQPHTLWSLEYPQALKYGTLGFVLARAIIYGVDDDGGDYDEFGNLAPWWDTRSIHGYMKRSKCFQAQYHNYTFNGQKLADDPEQSVQITDNGAIRLAYAAYQRWLEQQPAEMRQMDTLPGLDLNNHQLFFVGFAQLMSEDVLWLYSTIDGNYTTPYSYRVIGSVSNFKEFSKVFKCSHLAPMNPKDKCEAF